MISDVHPTDLEVYELLEILEEQNAPEINELSTEEAREFFRDFAISEQSGSEPVGADEDRSV